MSLYICCRTLLMDFFFSSYNQHTPCSRSVNTALRSSETCLILLFSVTKSSSTLSILTFSRPMSISAFSDLVSASFSLAISSLICFWRTSSLSKLFLGHLEGLLVGADHLQLVLDVDELRLNCLGSLVRPHGLCLHRVELPGQSLVLVLRFSQRVLSVLQLGLQPVVVLALLGAHLADHVLVLDALVRLDRGLGKVGGADGQPLLRLHAALLHLLELDRLVEQVLCAHIEGALSLLDLLLQVLHLLLEPVGGGVDGGHLLLPLLRPGGRIGRLPGQGLHLLLDRVHPCSVLDSPC